MRAFEFLTEYRGGAKYHGITKKYRDGGKPDWYEEAVKLKTDNPRMTAAEIGKLLGRPPSGVLNWLAGTPNTNGRIVNDNPPFTSKDFPNIGKKKYFDGEKPWWYKKAVAMREKGMSWQAISNKLSTPEEKVSLDISYNWLTKGRKVNGKLVNPDAPFKPRPYNTKKIDTALLKELIVDKYTDEQIIELIADEKGDKIANQVRAMLPKLRQKLQPGTEVRNKVTGDDITGFVQ